ncbi:PAS domain-containing protein [Stenotrophomonas sp. HITSZ_GD]|uniref:helix-turn-helix transcriptional regulator n=1 Tax=Stenotrophomonas sp. HITSZ_GD TaxID=3037248 RepID=UPI00240DC2C6|nr:PAS domain-containing protein [Stenotrophomonas sp. HITSZ_GD]MDG2524193.1 PAS domain-containing protein [Stenotrophomonas sp. HITSZ_GD]
MPKRPDAAALAPYFPVADAVAALFRPHVEVVVHDLVAMKIAHIANALSKRKVGDSSSDDRFPDHALAQPVIGPYRKANTDGRHMRCITVVIRDEKERPRGMLCINFDVTMLERVRDSLGTLAFLPASPEPENFFHDSWRQVLEQIVSGHEAELGMSARALDAAARRELIARLHAARILDIRNAAPVVAARLGISRALLYKHLKEIRSMQQDAGD